MEALDGMFFFGTIIVAAFVSMIALFIASVWPLR